MIYLYRLTILLKGGNMKKYIIWIIIVLICGTYIINNYRVKNKEIKPNVVKFNFNQNIKYVTLRKQIAKRIYGECYTYRHGTDSELKNTIEIIVKNISAKRLDSSTNLGTKIKFKIDEEFIPKPPENVIDINFITNDDTTMYNSVYFY
jgi:hypothetical protein